MVNLTPRSIRDKLFLFSAILVLAPALLVGILSERTARESLRHAIGSQLAREASHTAERLSLILQRERDSLRSFARQDLMRDLRVADIDKRVAQALITLRGGHPARVDYLVADPDGRVLAASRPSLLVSTLHRIEGLVSNGSTDGRAGPISQPGGPTLLLMSTSIPDPDDESLSLGRLVGLYDWRTLSDVTEVVRRDLEMRDIPTSVLVADVEGRVLAAVRSSGGPPANISIGGQLFAGIPESGDSLVDEESGLIVGRAELSGEADGWTLLVVETLEHALAPVRRLRDRIAIATAVALAGALALAAFAARRVVHPLVELTSAIQGLSRRDPSILRVPVRTRDEVGALSEAFNHMASELERVQHDLVDAEKFAFVGQLASGVAHEVRTSLGVLRSSAQIMERSLPDHADSQAHELARMMRDEVDRLGGVVDDLLTLGRSRRFHPEPTSITVPLERAVQLVEPRAEEKGIAIRLKVSEPPATVLCDVEMIQEVCVNLLVNAVEALPKGGRIEVETLSPKEGFAGFLVRDNGAGVPEALRDRIFQPFVTARDGGVGLGLTFVKRVIHENQGRIHLEPEFHHGACFRVELPVAEVAS